MCSTEEETEAQRGTDLLKAPHIAECQSWGSEPMLFAEESYFLIN